MTTSPGLSLLVLRARDIDRTRQFYELLGLTFIREKHGAGPEHFAAALPGDVVLEIYPGRRATAGVRLGLRVADPEAAIARIVAAGLAAPPRHSAGRGGHAIHDPDGNTVALTAWVAPGQDSDPHGRGPPRPPPAPAHIA